jgi:hypothetical protein
MLATGVATTASTGRLIDRFRDRVVFRPRSRSPGLRMDAIAVTIATQGSHVGISPLGTSLTNEQAAQLDRLGVDTVRTQPELAAADALPPWLGDEAVHRSHQSALVRKGQEHYRPLFPDLPDDLPYVWPVRSDGHCSGTTQSRQRSAATATGTRAKPARGRTTAPQAQPCCEEGLADTRWV